jgi:hypothetical protein
MSSPQQRQNGERPEPIPGALRRWASAHLLTLGAPDVWGRMLSMTAAVDQCVHRTVPIGRDCQADRSAPTRRRPPAHVFTRQSRQEDPEKPRAELALVSLRD